MKIKRLLILLIVILTLIINIGTSIGYCDLDDPEPWSVETGTLQN
ncbi:hypothetical protein [Caloranaerobacter ferrireducens]|nr:hypothetical protein [Caloranaerobacter ferrireducens]